MEKLIISASDDTPGVILNKDANQFEFSGKSLPEDVNSFYGPILKWIEAYGTEANATTDFTFKLTYFNTASSKVLLDILMKLEDIKNAGKTINIKWMYPSDDEDMLEAGKEYADLVELTFDFLPYNR